MHRPSLYLETTVVGYLTGRKSRDIIILAHQEITHQWWDTSRFDYDVFSSEAVIQEAMRGDSDAAQSRLAYLKDIPLLDFKPEVEELAGKYITRLAMPEKAIVDAVHLAFAVLYEMDYLLTWNCAHLANELFQRRLVKLNYELFYRTPLIVTPEDLLMGSEEVQ